MSLYPQPVFTGYRTTADARLSDKLTFGLFDKAGNAPAGLTAVKLFLMQTEVHKI